MPVSHIGLTVSHLPTSASFFLSALQPLGYRYIGQSGNQIGLGIKDADFFLCQEGPGLKAGAAHIAFTAASTAAVRNFYASALLAGGRPNGAPACRSETGHFNAAVLDFDGNSIEVVYGNGPDLREDGSVVEHSRIITWQRTVSHSYSYRESGSTTSSRSATSHAVPNAVPTQVEPVASHAPSMARSASTPVVPTPVATASSHNNEDGASKIFGTLLGAAAGAAGAYAFVRSERDSAKKEADFTAYMDAKNAVKTAAGFFAQATSQPQPPQQAPQPAPAPPAVEAPPPVPSEAETHRDIGDVDAQSSYSATPSRASQIPRSSVPRMIEAAPPEYYSPTLLEAPSSHFPERRAIEYVPAASVAPSQARTRLSSAHRSHTSPELLTIERARSNVSAANPESFALAARPPKPPKPESSFSKSKAQSVAPSAAPSSLISSFVADPADKRSSGSSEYSHQSSRSKAKSSHTEASKHSKHSSSRSKRDSSPTPSKAESKPPPKVPSKAASIVSSIFSRKKHDDDDNDDFIDDLDIEELTEDDLDTVVPSDSISQIGSAPPRRKHRSHRSKKHDENDDESSVSKSHRSSKKHDDAESSISKSSKHSHRSERTHRTHRSHKPHSPDSADEEESSRPRRSSRSSKPSVIASETSDASTIKPVKSSSKSSSSSSSRKDSVTQGQYDNLFDEAVQYGAGGVAVRAITPSMVSAARKNPSRSLTTFTHAQKMRNFEGSQAGSRRRDDE